MTHPDPTPADRDGLRDRIADILATADGWSWLASYDRTQSPTYRGYLERADKVLALLPAPDQRAAADIRALTSQRDRYRTAWRSALERAQAHREGTLRQVANRDFWKGQCKAAEAEAANLRSMYDVAIVRENDLIEERDQLLERVAELERSRAELLRGLAGEAQQDEPTESVIYEVVGDWGVDSADSAEGARAAVAKWLRAHPKCGAYAQQRVVREWPDGSEFYGPWTDLPDSSAAGEQQDGAQQ